jgi:hypothetical protein
VTVQPAGSDSAKVCLLCGRRVAWNERRCPAFALAGVAAHAGCCGGRAATTTSAAADPRAKQPRSDALSRGRHRLVGGLT